MWESNFIWKMNYPVTFLFWIYRYIKENHASACFLITHAALNSLSECMFENYSFCSINVSSNCTQIFGNNTRTCPNYSLLLERMLFLCPILRKRGQIVLHLWVSWSVHQMLSTQYLLTPFLQSCQTWYTGYPLRVGVPYWFSGHIPYWSKIKVNFKNVWPNVVCPISLEVSQTWYSGFP